MWHIPGGSDGPRYRKPGSAADDDMADKTEKPMAKTKKR